MKDNTKQEYNVCDWTALNKHGLTEAEIAELKENNDPEYWDFTKCSPPGINFNEIYPYSTSVVGTGSKSYDKLYNYTKQLAHYKVKVALYIDDDVYSPIMLFTDRYLVVLNNGKVYTTVPLSKIDRIVWGKRVKMDRHELNNYYTSKRSPVAGAIVGGMIAGSTGAVVGAMANQGTKTSNIKTPVWNERTPLDIYISNDKIHFESIIMLRDQYIAVEGKSINLLLNRNLSRRQEVEEPKTIDDINNRLLSIINRERLRCGINTDVETTAISEPFTFKSKYVLWICLALVLIFLFAISN